MNYCFRVRAWRITLLAVALLVWGLALNACATTPGATAKSMQPLANTTAAFVAQGDLWLTQHGARARQLTHLATAATAWSTLFWSPDTTQLAATNTDASATAALSSLVIADTLTATTTITPHAISSHEHIAGWIAGGWLLLAGDAATPGLSAYDTSTGASVTITTAPVATFALAAGAVWFVGQQQQPGAGALLMHWGAGTQATTAVAFLPGFAVGDDGAACGRIALTADGTLMLYDSLFGAAGTPCPRPNGAQMMSLAGGMAWPLFAALPAPVAGTQRDFTLDPAGQWVAAVDRSPAGAIATAVAPVNNSASPARLPVVTLAGAASLTLVTLQNMLVVTAPDTRAASLTDVALIATDGSGSAIATLAGTDVAIAPTANDSITAGTDATTCPMVAAPADASAARIAIIGDSLAQGYGTTVPTQCSFAAQLGALRSPLTFGRLPTLMIRGMGGFRADQMLTSVADLVAFMPDVVVVELGTNDEREGWPLDQTQAAYDTILATLHQAAGSHVAHPALACLSLWPSPDFDAPAQLAPYNTLIAQECARFGGSYIDITALATMGMSDGSVAPDFNWHPNNRGALNLARLIMSVLDTAATPTPVPSGQS